MSWNSCDNHYTCSGHLLNVSCDACTDLSSWWMFSDKNNTGITLTYDISNADSTSLDWQIVDHKLGMTLFDLFLCLCQSSRLECWHFFHVILNDPLEPEMMTVFDRIGDSCENYPFYEIACGFLSLAHSKMIHRKLCKAPRPRCSSVYAPMHCGF